MNLLPPFVRRYGMIPESYKLAMTYEEQLLWLCKHLEDIENEFTQFKLVVDNLTLLVNSFDERISKNATDIQELKSNQVIQVLDSDLDVTNNLELILTGVYYTGQYEVKQYNEDFGSYEILVPNKTLFMYNQTYNWIEPLTDISHPDILRRFYIYNVSENKWEVTTINKSNSIDSESTNETVPSSKAVYDFVTSYTPRQVIEELSQSISLTDDFVPLTTGLYYTHQYNITTPTGTIFPDPILMIPAYTLFYYDGAQNSFTLIYNEHTPNRTTWLNERWTWDSVGLAWEQLQYNVTDEVTSFASHTKLVTEYAVYQEIGNVETILQTLNSGNGVL